MAVFYTNQQTVPSPQLWGRYVVMNDQIPRSAISVRERDQVLCLESGKKILAEAYPASFRQQECFPWVWPRFGLWVCTIWPRDSVCMPGVQPRISKATAEWL
jgi:hypothetical protein